MEKLIIGQKDYELLKKHFSTANLSAFNKEKLWAELENADVRKEGDLPEDVVCLDSEVEIKEEKSGRLFNFRIVLPSKANSQKKWTSVFAPIAIAVLGYRTGSKVQWEMPDGMKNIEITKVSHKHDS